MLTVLIQTNACYMSASVLFMQWPSNIKVKYVEPKPEKSRNVPQKFLVSTARECLVFRFMTLKTERRKLRKMVQQFRCGMILGRCRVRVTA